VYQDKGQTIPPHDFQRHNLCSNVLFLANDYGQLLISPS
jgi:hypothetical protein